VKHLEVEDGTDNGSGEEWTACVQTAEPYVEPPTYVDTEMVLNDFKNGEATRHDQIPAELIKEGGKELKKVTYELISKIWEEEIVSYEWKCGIIWQIHKEGGTMMCDNYRAVTAYKIMANILYVN
jgi:hypothetical protein